MNTKYKEAKKAKREKSQLKGERKTTREATDPEPTKTGASKDRPDSLAKPTRR